MPRIHVVSDRESLSQEMAEYFKDRGIRRLIADYDKAPAATGAREHSELTAFYSLAIARALNIPKDERKRVCLAARFHDIGKVGMSRELLERQGLNAEYRGLIRKHPTEGELHIKNRMTVDPRLYLDKQTLIYIRDHHERYDGKGYPVGLAGEGIPLGARIIAVADAYATMTFGRTYRKPMTHDAALEEISENSGTQFDPKIVKAFVEIVSRKKG